MCARHTDTRCRCVAHRPGATVNITFARIRRAHIVDTAGARLAIHRVCARVLLTRRAPTIHTLDVARAVVVLLTDGAVPVTLFAHQRRAAHLSRGTVGVSGALLWGRLGRERHVGAHQRAVGGLRTRDVAVAVARTRQIHRRARVRALARTGGVARRFCRTVGHRRTRIRALARALAVGCRRTEHRQVATLAQRLVGTCARWRRCRAHDL